MSIKSILNKHSSFIVISLFVFILGFRPISAYDSLYTAHVGKMILQAKTIPHTETISWSREGAPWLIHQPIAQITLGILDTLGGPLLLSITAAAALAFFFLLMVLFFIRICSWHWIPAVIIAFFAAGTVAEFFIPRAQLFAQLYLIATLYILYRKLNHPTTTLLPLIPLTYLWATSHASFIFVFYLIGTSTLVAWIRKQSIRDFLIILPLTLGTSILPPIGLQGWQVLARFSGDMQFLTAYITEWAPLSFDYVHLTFYISLIGAALIGCLVFWKATKQKASLILIMPLVPIVLLGFISLRHVPFGITALFALVGLCIQPHNKKLRPQTIRMLLALFIPLALWLFVNKYTVAVDSAWFFPHKGAQFLREHRLQGRMFNEMALGSFLLYTVPEYKVFFDGRVEMFGSTQMREFYTLMQAKNAPRESFKNLWSTFDKKYAFSYAVIPFQSYNPLEITTTDRIADLLLDDLNWVLVYVDDTLRIFIKKDGKNTENINTYTLSYITPKRNQIYKEEYEKDAYTQLLRMNEITESAFTLTALGQIDARNAQTALAIQRFEHAAKRNPYWGLPLLEHAKLLSPNDQTTKEELLRTALARSPYLGEAYLALAELYLARDQTHNAKKILQQGLNANIDFITRRDIITKLQRIP